jgi:hypothetical protein
MSCSPVRRVSSLPRVHQYADLVASSHLLASVISTYFEHLIIFVNDVEVENHDLPLGPSYARTRMTEGGGRVVLVSSLSSYCYQAALPSSMTETP